MNVSIRLFLRSTSLISPMCNALRHGTAWSEVTPRWVANPGAPPPSGRALTRPRRPN